MAQSRDRRNGVNLTGAIRGASDLAIKINPLMGILGSPETVVRRVNKAAQTVRAASSMTPRALLKETKAQVSAGWNGGVDAATFGLADKKQALDLALMGSGRGRTVGQRYHSNRDLQLARDHYEQQRYGTSRNLGRDAGIFATIAATNGLGAAPAGVARIAPQVARVTGTGLARFSRMVRPDALAASAGAASAVGGQAVSDLVGLRLSDPRDYLSAAAGGAAGGLTAFRGGTTAAAVTESGVGAGVTSLLKGEPVSRDQIERDALAGAVLGNFANRAGAQWSNNLPTGIGRRKDAAGWDKGKLGEMLSRLKTRIYGDDVDELQKSYPVVGGTTRADHSTLADFIVEAKFGWWPRLTARQRQAVIDYANRYQVDHFTPGDIGNAFGGVLGTFSAQLPQRTDGKTRYR